MNAYVITHSTSFEDRAEAVGKWLQEQGARVTWVYSDFMHTQVRTIPRKKEDHVYLHMRPYRRNLSVRRMQSIYTFVQDVERFLTGKSIDLLYVIIPANTFVPMAKRLKAATGARVVFDILDLWPESLPIDHVQGMPPVRYWKNLRDKSISCADLVYTECEFYQEQVRLPEDRTHTLYWFSEAGKTGEPGPRDEEALSDLIRGWRTDSGRLHIAYLGSINYIIDIPMISKVIGLLRERRPVTVHVIGEGETKTEFMRSLKRAGAEVIDHGAIYDRERKAEILSRCDFGLNMMVPQVRVGLTMKSLDYLANGLPLLNTIGGDTHDLIEIYEAGVNVPVGDPARAAAKILAMADDPRAHENASRLYSERFTPEQFRLTLRETLLPLLERKGQQVGSVPEQRGESGPEREYYGRSVAIAACNGERFLDQQLDSILPQLSEADEVVVSVDPSADHTLERLCERAAEDPRIRVLEGPGLGVVKNVENALFHCRGRQIFLADQDDIWEEGKVEKISRLLEKDTLVIHDARIVNEDLEEIAPSFMNWRKSRKGLVRNIWKNSYIGCCMAFRKELLDVALPFPEDLPMHDQWLGLLAEKHGSVRLLHLPLIRYRRHGGSVTNDEHAKAAQMLKWRAAIAKEVWKR